MFLTFPSFNLYSMPLLILVLQGYIFAFLLLRRYFIKKNLPDLFLSLLLLITGYHTTTYTIGFMDWYDTYRNTKVNYWLIDLILAVGPLVYFYIKSLTQPFFKFRKKDLLHFLPALLFVIYKASYFIYDAQQLGFSDVQNGWFVENIHEKYIGLPLGIFKDLHYLGYFIFSFSIFLKHKKNIQHYYSNTYKVELNWLRTFLLLFIGLFILQTVLNLTEYSFFENRWIQRWWGNFAKAIIMLYVGMMSYFSDFTKLQNLVLEKPLPLDKSKIIPLEINDKLENEKIRISSFMEVHQPFLNPEITLPQLAKQMDLSTNQLSQIINNNFGKNFNEFINEYRVEMFKTKLQNEDAAHLSFLGIALDCGFNSKATFNRVFKKITNLSPSEYQKKLNQG